MAEFVTARGGGHFQAFAGCVALAMSGAAACSAPGADTGRSVRATTEAPRGTTRHLVGLDEDVSYVHESSATRSVKYVVRGDGRVESVADLARAERAARARRFGAVLPELDARLASAGATELVPVGVVVASGVDWTRLSPRLRARDAAARRAAQDELRAAVTARAAAMAPALAAAGLRDAVAVDGMPALDGRATPAAIRAIGRMPGVVLVGGADFGRMVRFVAPNVVTDPGIDTSFNAAGYYGAGERVGIVEPVQCGLYWTHDRFAHLTPDATSGTGIVHQTTPITCMTNMDCEVCGGSDHNGNGECLDLGPGIGKRCIDSHASQVASVVAASHGGTRHGAAEVTIFAPNQGVVNPMQTDPDVVCSWRGLSGSYSWLASRGVGITVESWGCQGMSGASLLEGFIQDYYARNYDVVVVKAAGNDGLAQTAMSQACPHHLNGLCVGGITASGTLWTQGNWRNPTGSDREEPDLVALAEDASILGINSTSAVAVASGTSFAAPGIAGTVAMLQEACGWYDPRTVRAILRTSTWSRNPHGSAYSTPQSACASGGTCDQRDGSGALTAANVLAFCHGGGEGVTTTTGTLAVNPTLSSQLPTWVSTPSPARADAAPGAAARVGAAIQGLSLAAGTRVRFTLAWDSCPPDDDNSPAPIPIALDLDVALCNNALNICVGRSESFDDNNEGFDVTIPTAAGGTWTLYYLHPPGATGCNGSSEPASWALAYGAF